MRVKRYPLRPLFFLLDDGLAFRSSLIDNTVPLQIGVETGPFEKVAATCVSTMSVLDKAPAASALFGADLDCYSSAGV